METIIAEYIDNTRTEVKMIDGDERGCWIDVNVPGIGRKKIPCAGKKEMDSLSRKIRWKAKSIYFSKEVSDGSSIIK